MLENKTVNFVYIEFLVSRNQVIFEDIGGLSFFPFVLRNFLVENLKNGANCFLYHVLNN